MQTINAVVGASCERYGVRPALRHKENGIWRETTYGELGRLSDRFAAGLLREGFRPGDHAALLGPSSPLWVAAYLGILKMGGVVVPIDKELKEAELRHILRDSNARVVLSEGQWLELAREMAADLPDLMLAAPLSGTIAGEADAAPPILVAAPPRTADDTALILYTSGTGGRPKGAMLSHANVVSNIRAAVAHLDLDDSISTLSFLPINHVYEQVCGVLLPLSLGGVVTFCESIKKLGENLAEVNPSFLTGVPAVYRMILDRIMKKVHKEPIGRMLFSFPPTRPLVQRKIRRAFGAKTIFVSGGAALDPAVAQGLISLGLTIYQGYGITETSPIISAETHGARRLGSVGRPLPGVEVRIDNPNDEGVGEIVVRGDNVMQGYYRNPQATTAVLRDGWYRTGDLGKLDDDGFLTIYGRVKNLIVTPNGKNVYPEEVENELLKSPFIAEVMVYGHRTGSMEEEVHAMIYPDQEALDDYAGRQSGGPTLSNGELEALLKREVQTACRTLADYKRVRRFTIRGEEFPKTSTRKIKRYEVEATISAL